ncbi:hypothetical protein Hanom_Chr03g00226601 [Helianthus anomalus]
MTCDTGSLHCRQEQNHTSFPLSHHIPSKQACHVLWVLVHSSCFLLNKLAS